MRGDAAFIEFAVIGHQQSPFAGGCVLVPLETENADLAEGARLAPVEAGAIGLRTVLQHGNATAVGHRHDGADVTGRPGHV